MPIICIKFEQRLRKDNTTEDWVEYASDRAVTETGQFNSTTWSPIRRLKPADAVDRDESDGRAGAIVAQWLQIEPHYEAWKQGHSLDTPGTPLSVWPGLNADQIKALRGVGIATVEQLSTMSEDMLMRPPLPDCRNLKRLASDWLKSLPMASMQAEMEKMREQNEALIAMIAEQQEAKEEPEKRGPGRPRKEVEAA